jgi:hypothetical protein
MSTEQVEALRVQFFQSGKYMRGTGLYQSQYNELRSNANNLKFMWLYNVYHLWFTQHMHFGKDAMVKTAKVAGIDSNFAKQVAEKMACECKNFQNVAAGMVDTHELLDVCLNIKHYNVVCQQLLQIATELLTSLDDYMDTLLLHIKGAPSPQPKEHSMDNSNINTW